MLVYQRVNNQTIIRHTTAGNCGRGTWAMAQPGLPLSAVLPPHEALGQPGFRMFSRGQPSNGLKNMGEIMENMGNYGENKV